MIYNFEQSADDEPHLHCLTSSYVFIFPACKLTRDSWLVTCIGMQNEEKSTQFTMESCHVCSLLAFSIRIPSHTPNSGHLLLESNMAARYNSFAYTKNRVSRLQGFTNREIKVIILYLRNRRLWRSSTENLRIRTPISFRLRRPP